MNDPEIRELLRPQLIGGIQIDELVTGSTRADIVHVHPDYMHGYEIKGSGDTLKRVENQLRCYGRVYDYVTFVVTPGHLEKLLLLLPRWVGVYVATPAGITPTRTALRNPVQERGQVTGLLRQAEVKSFLKAQGITGCSKLRDWELVQVLNKSPITMTTIGAYVRERLTIRFPERMRAREHMRLLSASDRQAAKDRKVADEESQRNMQAFWEATPEHEKEEMRENFRRRNPDKPLPEYL